MVFLNNLLGKYKKKRNEEFSEAIDEMIKWSDFMSSVLENKELIKRSSYAGKLDQLYDYSLKVEQLNKKIIFLSDNTITEFKELFDIFQYEVNSFESQIDAHNTSYLKGLVNDARLFIGKIDDHDLDDQQIMCILKDAHNHNVVAGAGTGKTTTIIGKVKYVINTYKYKPNEILVLSYTHAAAAEMKERLKRNTSLNINVSTFHRFGYYILTTVEKKKPLIFNGSSREIFKKELSRLLQNPSYRKKLIQYFSNPSGTDRSDLDPEFKSVEEYRIYVREHHPITIKGELVKSYGEMRLANILSVNGIRYIYEQRYQYETATKEYAQYTPDFYLPDYDIYIEYFGIDRNGNVPDWFEGDNPKQTYQEGIQWKRQIHKKYGTKLIECYAYEDFEGILQGQLEQRLVSNGVSFRNVSLEELLRTSGNNVENLMNTFLSSVESITSLARNKKLSSQDLFNIAGNNHSARLMAELVYPLKQFYESYLAFTNQIDFADMLVKAEQYIVEGKYHHDFKCIIVDEYQDVTSSQYRLLKALRESKDFELFCVGDDWQSIYQFNGSDVSYIMDFEDFWGDSELSRIETTYRFSQSLINVSSSFIMKNPRQIKKSIRSGTNDRSFAVSKIEGYKPNSAIQFMTDRMMYLPKDCSVFLIGRYTFDIKLLETEQRLIVKFDTATQTQKILLQNRPDLDITFYTAHRSKGLQADYVFILNNLESTLGFPSKVENNALTNMLLEHGDSYPFAEERRLFYVALTRAKKHVCLITIKGKESVFVHELENQYGDKIRNQTYVCPKCGGKLRIIDGKYGLFFGCENYRKNNCRFSAKIPD